MILLLYHIHLIDLSYTVLISLSAPSNQTRLLKYLTVHHTRIDPCACAYDLLQSVILILEAPAYINKFLALVLPQINSRSVLAFQ